MFHDQYQVFRGFAAVEIKDHETAKQVVESLRFLRMDQHSIGVRLDLGMKMKNKPAEGLKGGSKEADGGQEVVAAAVESTGDDKGKDEDTFSY
jgi:hypothetical protein